MDIIEELLTRGVDKIYPTKEELKKVLKTGKKLTLYQGFDPTGNQLHLGHMVGLLKLRDWQQLGHHVIFLIGDFTATIGDPTGKSTTRKVLTHEEVLENAKTYKEQASRILQFDGENPVEIRFNGNWLGKMSALKFLQLSRLLSVQQIVERDMFQERQKRGEDIYLNEFLYPVMQAYDCVAMNVDLEIGGTDQMFNMLIGRKLMRHMLKKDKFVITTPLLTDSEGKKIGKTEGNVIGLIDKPDDLFKKIMGLTDDVIVKGFEYLTRLPMNRVKDIEKKIKSGTNPIVLKKEMAFEITKLLNSEADAKKAQQEFERVVQGKERPSERQSITLPTSFASAATVAQTIVKLNLASSNSEAKRITNQGGTIIGDKKVENPNSLLSSVLSGNSGTVRVGRNYVDIIVSDEKK